ncbi:MAG: Holliday junction resolvase RuvX [Pseudanabaena sp.]
MQYAALGLDVGRKRIGVAGCDRLGITVHGITTIIRRSWQDDMEELRSLILDRNIDILVIGLPYNMDGSLGYQAKQVQKFANSAAKQLGITVEFVDERLTSYEAEEMMRSQGISTRENKALIDRKAAAIILQQWLAIKRHSD